MPHTYILKSLRDGKYYIGSCYDVTKRLKQHNHGLVKSTKSYRPWEVVHTEEYKDLASARQRELQIKAWKKRSAIESLIKHSKI